MVTIGGAIFNDDVQLVISISFFTSIETIEWYHRFQHFSISGEGKIENVVCNHL